MLDTRHLLEEELIRKASERGVRVTADSSRQANVVTYRTYDSEFRPMGCVTVHYEESFASLVNYAGRDAGDSFRYGDGTCHLVNEVLKRLKLTGDTFQPSTEDAKEAARKGVFQDAFPF